MRLALPIKANAMLVILWMMLMHTALPHVHHEYTAHTHLESHTSHSHDHHHGSEEEGKGKKSLIDLFFQNHIHSNHLPQTITVDHEKADLIKKSQRRVVEVAVSSNQDLLIPLNLDSEKGNNQEDSNLDPPFFTCNSLRGPPALG